mmetsp:Transcript_12874/g.31844  ORF Transcript_12874/g.31844 Transcript_12874/m.31844 type:complete len:125 (-) Transcript_12874:101-475(-)
MKVSVFLLLGALALFAVGVSASNPDGAQTTFREIDDEEEDLALSELTDVTERGGEPGCVRQCEEGYYYKCRWIHVCKGPHGHQVCYYKLVCKCVPFPYECPHNYYWKFLSFAHKDVWTCKPTYS